MRRQQLTVTGTVQGVGFRPFVYRLALELGLTGSVRNAGGTVIIDVQGEPASLALLESGLRDAAPLPAQVDRLICSERVPDPTLDSFTIAASAGRAAAGAALAPDAAICADCRAELLDPADRRYTYPLISCSRCGPRLTITRALPYDRRHTTMTAFPICAACAAEYADPLDRRFHAQPIACPQCGPRVWIARAGESSAACDRTSESSALDAARDALAAGQLLAVKGLGGFHLAVDARSDDAVARLRQRKSRARKPLAVMVRDLDTARRTVVLSEEDEEMLCSSTAPIVLAPARPGHGLSCLLAPELDDLGVMLPYTGIHLLLFDDRLDALVMTSGNAPAEPMISDEMIARDQLPADHYLLHDRPIHVACDDSVVRTSGRGPILVRRARGHVPRSIDVSMLPRRRILALGAELKVTVTILQGGELVVGRHLGDLDNPATEASFREEITRLLSFFALDPEAIAVDKHPDLYAVRYAEETFDGLPIFHIQHHHAHLGALLAEHGVPPADEVVGVILDGIGHGDDQTIWGGEVLRGGFGSFTRIAHLCPVPLPGGDRAAREPLRMAVSLLVSADLADAVASLLPSYDDGPRVAETCAIRAVSPLTSSTGRLFDGVAALLGIAPAQQEFEGEAAARLEACVDVRCADAYPLPLLDGQLDTRVLVRALLEDRSSIPIRAARFHNGLADGLARAALQTGVGTVALGGGCMVNRVLLHRLVTRFDERGLRVLLPRRLPPGDGGLSAGQAACTACLL